MFGVTSIEDDTRAHTKRMATSSFLANKRARARSLPFVLACANTAAVLVRLVGASTSLPSSSSELCPDETAACFDSPFCWDCVAQFADSSGFCEDLYPVLAVNAGTELTDECEVASALYCCSFDASGQDCTGDAVTMDFFRCGLLEEYGCVLSDSPCSGGSDSTLSSGTSVGPATPAPAPDDSQNAPTTPPPTISPTETIVITLPSPVEDVPLPSTPSPAAVDRGAVATSGAAGGAAVPSRSRGSYYCRVVLSAGWWTAAVAAAAASVVVVF